MNFKIFFTTFKLKYFYWFLCELPLILLYQTIIPNSLFIYLFTFIKNLSFMT